jgi:alcohol dehydrogenase (cytochrome c)
MTFCDRGWHRSASGLKYLIALLAIAQGALGQTTPSLATPPSTQPSPSPSVGSAGESAAAKGAIGAAQLPTSFPIEPVTARVDITDERLLNADKQEDDWLMNGRTYDNQRYSPLTQITARNVRLLKPTAIIQTGIPKSFENTPIEVDGVLYIETGDNNIQAYDAITGKELWSYQPSLEFSNLCCGQQARGVAIAYGKVFAAQLDGHVVALDARTGKVIWKTDNAKALPAPAHFYSFTSAPLTYNGLVLVGNAGAEWPTRGFVEALDAKTGELVWRFNTTAAPDEPGGDTWSGDSWKVGGGSVWNTPAVDTKNGLILFATGNPNPDLYGEGRKGDNAYTDSIVAINAKTGKLVWWYQEVAHDLWDFDANAPVVLFDTVDETGKTVPAAAEAGKVGYLFIVNRLNGKLIRKSEPFVPIGPNMFRPPDETPTVYQPGNKGGAMWSPPAYSPKTHDFYTMGVNEAHIFVAHPIKEYVPGTPIVGQFAAGSMATDLSAFPPSGTFTAIDATTGKIAWQYKSSRPMYGGALATASNLVFTGEMTGDVVAFDARTGEKLWHFPMGAGVCTPPITYRIKRVQYLAVGASGCHGGEVLMKNDGRPIFGDALAIFALPE